MQQSNGHAKWHVFTHGTILHNTFTTAAQFLQCFCNVANIDQNPMSFLFLGEMDRDITHDITSTLCTIVPSKSAGQSAVIASLRELGCCIRMWCWEGSGG